MGEAKSSAQAGIDCRPVAHWTGIPRATWTYSAPTTIVVLSRPLQCCVWITRVLHRAAKKEPRPLVVPSVSTLALMPVEPANFARFRLLFVRSDSSQASLCFPFSCEPEGDGDRFIFWQRHAWLSFRSRTGLYPTDGPQGSTGCHVGLQPLQTSIIPPVPQLQG